jgi:hypothetical protein
MNQKDPDATPRDRVAVMLHDHLRSIEITDLIEPADPAPRGPEFDVDQRFYTPVHVIRATRPFSSDESGTLTLREGLIMSIADLRRTLRDQGVQATDCKAYLPERDEERGAIVYFRLGGIVYTAIARLALGDAGDRPDSIWDLILAVNVETEALDIR